MGDSPGVIYQADPATIFEGPGENIRSESSMSRVRLRSFNVRAYSIHSKSASTQYLHMPKHKESQSVADASSL